MKVFVTGTQGYIGSLLGPYLMSRGHEVVGLDTAFYQDGVLFNQPGEQPRWINKDIRRVEAADLDGCEAVAHLAELSNDPLGQHNPEITFAINHKGSTRLAEICRKIGIPRFVYMSSCSVYGVGVEEIVTEKSAVNPQTAYAQCKVLVERDLGAMADDRFSPTFLRNATAFGPSPRMRFDIVLNNLAGLAWTTKEIKMTSDGMPWRPLVHLLDICEAIACSLEAPREVVHNQVFNVGRNEQNFRVKEIAEIVAEVFPGCALSFGAAGGDNRSYRVDFTKIHRALPAFRCERTARLGAEQLRQVFESIRMQPETFTHRSFTRLKQLQHLQETGQVSSELHWKNALS